MSSILRRSASLQPTQNPLSWIIRIRIAFVFRFKFSLCSNLHSIRLFALTGFVLCTHPTENPQIKSLPYLWQTLNKHEDIKRESIKNLFSWTKYTNNTSFLILLIKSYSCLKLFLYYVLLCFSLSFVPYSYIKYFSFKKLPFQNNIYLTNLNTKTDIQSKTACLFYLKLFFNNYFL